jgi:hypothetical protein
MLVSFSPRQLSDLLCPEWWRDRTSVVGLFAEQRIELTGKAATAAAKRQRKGACKRQAAP